MSATIYLYRIVSDVTYTGTIYDKVPVLRWFRQRDGFTKLYKYEKANGAPDYLTSPLMHDEWVNLQYDNCWSDGRDHKSFKRYTAYIRKELKSNRAYRRIAKRLNGFNWSCYPTADGETTVCLPVEEVLYYSGWFFKKKFFKKKCTVHYCVTKDQVVHFFNQYITSTKKYDANFVRDMKESILNAWEDGMILEVSF